MLSTDSSARKMWGTAEGRLDFQTERKMSQEGGGPHELSSSQVSFLEQERMKFSQDLSRYCSLEERAVYWMGNGEDHKESKQHSIRNV